MPVVFQNQTEYSRQFDQGMDPNDPPLPEFYKHPTEHKALPQKNGLTQEPPLQHKKHAVSNMEHLPHQYKALEPPIQRKKKPVQPKGLNPTEFVSNGREVWHSGDEYVLLGNQKKFTPNIMYKAKPVTMSQEAENVVPEEVVTPMAPRPDPAPRVVIDTGAPRQSRKKELRQQQNGHTEPIQQSGHPVVRKSPPKPTHSSAEPHDRSRPRERRPTKVAHANKPANNEINGQVQNGDMSPEDQAPADYALKYKAGVAPPRTQGPKRLSEYQRQFEWKKGVEMSPLLDAEQVVHKSSTQLVPRKAKFHQTTEYNKQFQAWQSMPGPIAPKPSGNVAPTGKARIPRSKSVEALSPDRRDPAGKGKITTDVDPRLVHESMNPLRLHFPHGPQKQYSSEYAANFAPPQIFECNQGAWKGASQPHLQAERATKGNDNKSRKQKSKSHRQNSPPPESPTEVTPPNNNIGDVPNSWYSEVVELRRRADEYKRRAHGTHFSRQHLAQLLAQQADMWDTASTSSVLSALSLESPHINSPPKIKKKFATAKAVIGVPPAGKKTAWGSDREPVPNNKQADSLSSNSVATMDGLSAQSEISDTLTLEDVYNEDQISAGTWTPVGRIPTPKMSQDGLRHHLDRTTPLRGGALLSSPPRGQAVAPARHGHRKLSASQESETLTESSVEMPVQHKMSSGSRAVKSSNSQVRCTCGVECDNRDPEISKMSDKVIQTEIIEPASVLARAATSKPKLANGEGRIINSSSTYGKKKRSRSETALTKLYNARNFKESLVSPTWDSTQFQHTMDNLGKIQQEMAKVAEESQSRVKQVKNTKNHLKQGKRPKSRTIPLGPKPTKTHSDNTHVSKAGHDARLRQTESCREGFDENGDLSLADRLERQIQITEGLRQTSQSVNKLVKQPIFGMPTRDAHVLLDETASTDRPLATNYVHGPVKATHNRDKFPGVNIPTTIQESASDTYKALSAKHLTGKRSKSSQVEVTLADIPPRPRREDDMLSTSVCSIASSCSLASEVLERAKSRRDDFWGVSGRA